MRIRIRTPQEQAFSCWLTVLPISYWSLSFKRRISGYSMLKVRTTIWKSSLVIKDARNNTPFNTLYHLKRVIFFTVRNEKPPGNIAEMLEEVTYVVKVE